MLISQFSNFSKFLIVLLALPIFPLFYGSPQCRYVLQNLARGYTRTAGHAVRLSIFISNQTGGFISKNAYSVTEKF